MKFKLTTECGYRWRWDQMYYWKGWYKPRNLGGDGVAFGPVMFFWKYS
jgi:hypothetical protein